MKTGHPIVDAVADLKLSGNLIPSAWFHSLTDKRGMPYYPAILVLSEIVFWYKPKSVLKNGKPVWAKAFKADCFQLNRGAVAKKFNLEKDTVSKALTYLENRGLIGRTRRDVVVDGRGYRNLLFVWPIAKKLEEISASNQVEEGSPQDGGDVTQKNKVTSCHSTGSPALSEAGDVAPLVGADTETTTQNSQRKTTKTTAASAASLLSLLSPVDGGFRPHTPDAGDAPATPDTGDTPVTPTTGFKGSIEDQDSDKIEQSTVLNPVRACLKTQNIGKISRGSWTAFVQGGLRFWGDDRKTLHF